MLVTRPRPVTQTLPQDAKMTNTNVRQSNQQLSSGSSSSAHSEKTEGSPAMTISSLTSTSSDGLETSNAIISQAKDVDEQDFLRFRPSFHLIAPKNWMNDPCGPCYDENTGLYHLLYQYNPEGASWGNMSWLHATSIDMVHWTHVSKTPSFTPQVPHDCKGVFSGAMVPHGPLGEANMLTAFYTAVSYLPIHWTKPYHWGCEKLAIATSTDGGQTWNRDESSVLLQSPPVEHQEDIASWRDPFISAWPEMDDQLGLPRGKYLYGLIAGGLRNKTPTAFLYRIEKYDLTKWTFISTIADVGLNHTLGKASGEMGRNWEVCNFFTLPQIEKDAQYLLMNVEGVGEDFKSRHPMWAQSSMTKSKDEKGITMHPFKSGILDHGSLYAATTFYHQPTSRRILWGWITEDDLAESRYDQQGWSGCISLPREIITLSFENVDPVMLQHPLIAPTFDFNQANQSSTTGVKISTLGVKAAEEIAALRKGSQYHYITKPSKAKLPIKSRNFELSFDVIVKKEDIKAGIHICHDADGKHGVKIVYSNETIQVIRQDTTSDPDVQTKTITVPFVPLRFIDGTFESLRFHLFLDNSVLELFVNDRVCITTRIYWQHQEALQTSLLPTESTFQNVQIWSGLQKAMLDEGVHADQVIDGVAHL